MDDAQQTESRGSFSLRLVRVGSVDIAIPEAEVLTVIDWREPSPLPFAPTTVVGVVSVHGRMLTVLDTAKLLGVDSGAQEFILALRGREQLALAITASQETIEIDPADIRPEIEFLSLSKGIAQRHGRIIHILETEKLFGVALLGHERRRRRF
jgi:chemotaxis signal transduction protein